MGPIHIPKFIAAAIRTFGPPRSLRLTVITLSLLLAFLSNTPVFAGTAVSGTISSNTIWAVVDSPYTIIGHVTVASGVTLTIDPGVTVKFDSGKVMEVEGTLVARGTSTSTVTFTSSASSPAAGDWGYIKFTGSSVPASFDGNGDYSSGSILEHCVVEYGGAYSDPDDGFLFAINGASYINYCTVRYNQGYAAIAGSLFPDWSSSDNYPVRITNSTITQNSGGAIAAVRNATITGNTITYNSNSGWNGAIYTGGATATPEPDRCRQGPGWNGKAVG